MRINPIFNNVRLNVTGVYNFLEQMFTENEVTLTDEDRKLLVEGYTSFVNEDKELDFIHFIRHFDPESAIYPILNELRSGGLYGFFTNERKFDPKKLDLVSAALFTYYLDHF